MHNPASRHGRAGNFFKVIMGAASPLLALILIGGCNEPTLGYRVPGGNLPSSRKIVVLPFMDTRTFVDDKDIHRDDLGEHAREIFTASLLDKSLVRGIEVLSPPTLTRTGSLTGAEAAEIGRQLGADLVVSGQIFSFTGTRAASIPPRAGMFIRILSADDAALLFVGDSYQSAPIPGASGGRELQAKNVATKLIDGFFRQTGGPVLAGGRITSGSALARLIMTADDDGSLETDFADGLQDMPLPQPPPFVDPPEDEIFDAMMPPKEGTVEKTAYRMAAGSESPAGFSPAERDTPAANGAASTEYLEMLAIGLKGDDLADDILAEGSELLAGAIDFFHSGTSAKTAFSESSVLSETAGPRESVVESSNAGTPSAAAVPVAETNEAESGNAETIAPIGSVPPDPDAAASPAESAFMAGADDESTFDGADSSVPFPDDGPVASIPLATEQPTLSSDPAAGSSGNASPATGASLPFPAVKVLVLPYHDRENPNNLIPNTGGGEVVTSIFGASLAARPEVRLLWDATGQATHNRLIDVDEAISMGRIAGADYVVRGQVVEFRRAQSVPSLYSAVISTAILAAQIVFAEMSGVDVATEVYRVSDGRCVMSRRDRAQQKYVVQAEKTVRRLAAGAIESLVEAMTSAEPEAMDPLIDTLSPATVLNNPH